MKQRPKCFQITITLWVILNHVINCVLFSTNKCFTPPISFQQLIIIIRCTFSIIGKDEWWIPRIQIFAFRVQHLPGWLTSVPLPSQAVWAAVGLLHRARCSGIRLLSHHIHDDSCPSWHSGARPAYRGVHGCERCAECKLQCILLCSMHPASKPGTLHWHRSSQSTRQRPKCVEIDAWATVGDTVIHKSPTLHKVNGKRIHYYGQG